MSAQHDGARPNDAVKIIETTDLLHPEGKIYTRMIQGHFHTLRTYLGWIFAFLFFVTPWLNWDGHQAVWWNIPERQYNIFFLTFWPQDFYLLSYVLIIAAFGLFAVTVWVGRVWCGYACPQTVWSEMFIWAEHFFEGDRNKRIKMDKAPWSANKLLRKGGKHASWLLIAFVTGITFIGYFTPIRELVPRVFTASISLMEFAWITFFFLSCYLNVGLLREQVCKFMCPYARFQGVMYDSNTLVVSYDQKRGEPRGARNKKTDSSAMGDCVDCKMCIQVCPTGIDIRNGMQYECIACGLCVDACNSIMDKLNYDPGLISYTSENALNGQPSERISKRFIGYSISFSIMVLTLVVLLLMRSTVELSVLRDRQTLYTENQHGQIENYYTLRISNKDQKAHTYAVTVSGMDGVTLKDPLQLTIEGGSSLAQAVTLVGDPAKLQPYGQQIFFALKALDDDSIQIEQEASFIGKVSR